MANLSQLRPIFIKKLNFQRNEYRFMSKTPKNDGGEKNSNSKLKKKKDKEIMDAIKKIPVPKNCCMSGCVNCVWIDYAEKLSLILQDSSGEIQKIILKQIEDPNMRAFLISELK